MIELFIIGAAILVLLWLWAKPGETIYLDESIKSKVFRSEQYMISAKPDRLVQVGDKLVDLHEYKTRKSRVYDSDIVEATAAAIAVSSEYQVRNIIIELGNGRTQTIRAKTPDRMFNDIKKHYEQARNLRTGKDVIALGTKGKCRYCGVQQSCSRKVT